MPKYDKIELYGEVRGNGGNVLAKGTVCTPDELVKAGMTKEEIKEAIKVGSMGEPIEKTEDGKPKVDPIELVFSGSPTENLEALGVIKGKDDKGEEREAVKQSPAPAAKQMDRTERVSGTR